MPPLADEFARACDAARTLADAGERARNIRRTSIRGVLTVGRLEYLYEIAYLRAFVAWEELLESLFLRYLCGYTTSTGVVTLAPGKSFQATLPTARAALYGGSQYLLWHNANKVIQRSKSYFIANPLEHVLNSAVSRLEAFSAVRHRVAHGHPDARTKFDKATMLLAGRRYPAGRAGRFLRDLDPQTSTTSPRSWLDAITDEMESIAAQLA